ncbi:hypothetical protein IHE44_0013152 [Lamprotornis superbus]|uniref:Uncharacterized protein n=1 Tax=Lamprotornis superbus TaxID=245042 RepID=A0A835P2W1_9PASS|nr:hypothetical protein IHE44_0013152 [Lamprotornis superbus]
MMFWAFVSTVAISTSPEEWLKLWTLVSFGVDLCAEGHKSLAGRENHESMESIPRVPAFPTPGKDCECDECDVWLLKVSCIVLRLTGSLEANLLPSAHIPSSLILFSLVDLFACPSNESKKIRKLSWPGGENLKLVRPERGAQLLFIRCHPALCTKVEIRWMFSLCGSQQPLARFLPPLGLLSQPHMALTHLKSSQAVKRGNSSEVNHRHANCKNFPSTGEVLAAAVSVACYQSICKPVSERQMQIVKVTAAQSTRRFPWKFFSKSKFCWKHLNSFHNANTEHSCLCCALADFHCLLLICQFLTLTFAWERDCLRWIWSRHSTCMPSQALSHMAVSKAVLALLSAQLSAQRRWKGRAASAKYQGRQFPSPTQLAVSSPGDPGSSKALAAGKFLTTVKAFPISHPFYFFIQVQKPKITNVLSKNTIFPFILQMCAMRTRDCTERGRKDVTAAHNFPADVLALNLSVQDSSFTELSLQRINQSLGLCCLFGVFLFGMVGFFDCEIWIENVPDFTLNTDIGRKKETFPFSSAFQGKFLECGQRMTYHLKHSRLLCSSPDLLSDILGLSDLCFQKNIELSDSWIFGDWNVEKWDAKKANKILVGSSWHVNFNDRARCHEKGEFFQESKTSDVVAESKNSRRHYCPNTELFPWERTVSGGHLRGMCLIQRIELGTIALSTTQRDIAGKSPVQMEVLSNGRGFRTLGVAKPQEVLAHPAGSSTGWPWVDLAGVLVPAEPSLSAESHLRLRPADAPSAAKKPFHKPVWDSLAASGAENCPALCCLCFPIGGGVKQQVFRTAGCRKLWQALWWEWWRTHQCPMSLMAVVGKVTASVGNRLSHIPLVLQRQEELLALQMSVGNCEFRGTSFSDGNLSCVETTIDTSVVETSTVLSRKTRIRGFEMYKETLSHCMLSARRWTLRRLVILTDYSKLLLVGPGAPNRMLGDGRLKQESV